jgi:dephospho-CoA kinase
MLFCVIGNLCSGKSSILKNNIPTDFISIDIDTYRKKYNPYMLKNREHYVYDAVRFAIQSNKKVIFESTGASKYFTELCSLHEITKIIKIDCSPEICLDRFHNRKTDNAFPFNFRPHDSIWYINSKLQNIKSDLILNSERESISELRTKILSYFLSVVSSNFAS